MRPLRWYIHSRVAGLILFSLGMLIVGLGVAQGVTTPGVTRALTTTLHSTTTQTRLVTIRVRGRVLRRHDHILVVLVPRTIFHTRTIPVRRIVVPKHVVRIHQPSPAFGLTSAVIGVAPPPATVTVTVEMPVPAPGPVTTVTQMVTTTDTTTEPGTTITVTVPLGDTG